MFKNKRNSFQALRVPATAGRPKRGEANRTVEATCQAEYNLWDFGTIKLSATMNVSKIRETVSKCLVYSLLQVDQK